MISRPAHDVRPCEAWGARIVRVGLGLLLLPLIACAPPPAAFAPPEADSALQRKAQSRFTQEAVVAAHPLAAKAGAAMLAAGGSAVDAAVAAQLVLGLVEPQSSGIGGGGFLVYWDGQRVRAYDGRETAPALADENLFLTAEGRPWPFSQAVASGASVGVPGLLSLLETAHRAHGRLPWAQLTEPARQLAEAGVPIGPRLHKLLQVDSMLRSDPAAAAHFYDEQGKPLSLGTRLRNPAYAALMQRVAELGAKALQDGPAGLQLVERVQQHKRPGRLSLQDLQGYRVLEREPTCWVWQRWRVCGPPVPASGALFVGQVLALSGPADLRTASGQHRFLEASRLAGADRDQHVGDPAFVVPPAGRWGSLLDADYLAERSTLIGERAAARVQAGQPRGSQRSWAPQPIVVEAGTTHLSVVDREGRAVSLTSSIESAFGNRMLLDGGTGLPGGYFANNQLTDFSFQPRQGGRLVANRVEGGKRPRSSMAPLLVFDRADGQLLGVLGSPGGLAIPFFLSKTLLHLQRGDSLQAAIDAPNLGHFQGQAVLEVGSGESLMALGHRTSVAPMTSGTHAIWRRPEGGWWAASDPRREGDAAGR